MVELDGEVEGGCGMVCKWGIVWVGRVLGDLVGVGGMWLDIVGYGGMW